jgi:hypothetical protein
MLNNGIGLVIVIIMHSASTYYLASFEKSVVVSSLVRGRMVRICEKRETNEEKRRAREKKIQPDWPEPLPF